MKPLFTKKEYESAKSLDKLPCECKHCKKTFYKAKRHITHELKSKKEEINFCSHSCSVKYNFGEQILKQCSHCGKDVLKFKCEIEASKSGNVFCSKSCSTSYNNIHKTHGNRRSKLELYIESQLTCLYPDLTILYNNKKIINSELDIYIPSLNLAFELNGIFHYEPIFGENKLKKIKNNDERKFQACLEKKIELVIIDSSQLKYFKPQKAQNFLNIIVKIIAQKYNAEIF